tara:strand:+ start:533 stop:1291 length:759 start_codon:yes stop_codon:yes gene_type:complete
MNNIQIPFLDDKKKVITRILDTAITRFHFEQKEYLKIKAMLMKVIENPEYANFGLNDVVALTNKMIAKVADHSGYVIVNPELKKKTESLSILEEHHAIDSFEHTENSAIKYKEKLISLAKHLSPLISKEEIETFTAQIKNATFDPLTGSKLSATTADIENSLVQQLIEIYLIKVSGYLEKFPNLFYENIHMADGKSRQVDNRKRFREKLFKITTLTEFLSLKDVVDRKFEIITKDGAQAAKDSSWFFWRKKN